MNIVIFFTDLFESFPDYRKIVLLMFSIKIDVNFLHKCGFLKGDKNFLYKELKNFLLDVNEEYLDHIKSQEETTLEKFFK